ncbi:MAG: long-chain fatty acid--CoA ligase [Alphaproteobacteria bacterium]|nr:long-chain fatty acid--CoA ligase [Alphaproteobacteria bacterium]
MLLPFDRFGTIVDKALNLTWDSRTLADAVGARALELAKMGAAPGGTVAITHGGTAHFFADLFAVWSCGAAAACLDPALTASERQNVIAFCKPVLVLGENGALTAGTTAPPRKDQSLENTALILFTSGTTGAPKGVALPFRAILARLALNQYEIGRETLARALVTLPTHFGHGLIGNALTPLTAGGDIVLAPRGLALAQSLGALIDEHRITFMSSVPSLWQMALRLSPRPKDKSLNRVHIGSAPLSAALWSRIADWTGCDVVNCYGITETANWIGGASSHDHTPADGLIGRPWGGTAGVKGDDGIIRTQGTGEIVVQTPSLMSGYLDRPDLTAAVMNNGWYATGDLGEVDALGNVRLTGRAKDEINRAGFKIQPAEIDMLLDSHPSVAEACTFGAPDTVSGEIVAAAIRLNAGAKEDAASLRDWCLKRLRREATPERWFFVEEIPKTSRGKVSRDAVRKALIK